MLGTELENNTAMLHKLIHILRGPPTRPAQPLGLPFPPIEARFKPRQSSRIQYLSVYKTLDTTELLEHILLDLPIRDIVICRGVNKMFRDTITGSKTIQKTIFFAPDPDNPSDAPRFNPVLDGMFRRGRGCTVHTGKYQFNCDLYLGDRMASFLQDDTATPDECNSVRLEVWDLYWRSEEVQHVRPWTNMVLVQPPGEATVVHRDSDITTKVKAATMAEAIDKLINALDGEDEP